MNNAFFPQLPKANPTIYAYRDLNPKYKGYLKIGFTTQDVETRVKQQYSTLRPNKEKPYEIVFAKSAMFPDGGNFTDHDIHKYLKKQGIECVGGEWYKCSIKDLEAAWIAVRFRIKNIEHRTQNFALRKEQQEFVDDTIKYFVNASKERPNISPKFLWNAKMRFGKTFTAYQLAKKMKLKRVLILTFKPAVESSWKEDLNSHIDFEGWQFISDNDAKNDRTRLDYNFASCDKTKPIVVFGSLQNLLGTNINGGIKAKNEFIHKEKWDIVIFDEYHYGAWKENSKKLFEEFDEEKTVNQECEINSLELMDETWLPIKTKYYLYLSGTPFRAINTGEFIEEQIKNWTYSDEQKAKANWKGKNNPYECLPRMVMMTYEIPEEIRKVAMKGEFNEFDLNTFFEANGEGDNAKFVFENEVQKWLDLICGNYWNNNINELKLVNKKGKTFLPFKETALLNILCHTLWFLPNVSSCYAMKNLLMQKQNNFYHKYNIVVCAGKQVGNGVDALIPVRKAMSPDPKHTKSITLTCGKLTTGVTVKPWTGIFMLRNLSSPETYFQAAFRIQSPWVTDDEQNKKIIQKSECYIFDFALNRALKQIADYATKLDINEPNPEKKVKDFISFLPVLAHKDGRMTEINAAEILDIVMNGTTASLLAKRWESALLVNVDNDTLKRLLANEKAMSILMKIEGFRNLNSDISIVISKSESVKNKRNSSSKLSKKEVQKLTEEQKEYQNKRKQIQEKLIKFATRVPIFMYLTDYREFSLEDVINKLEPLLFKKVTGITVDDFNLLVSLGIFNKPLMDEAIYKFKRYEDSSLTYAGINKHEGENVGLFDTVLSPKEYQDLYKLQQQSADLENFNRRILSKIKI